MENIGKDLLIFVLFIGVIVFAYLYFRLKKYLKPIVKDITGASTLNFYKDGEIRRWEQILKCAPPAWPCAHADIQDGTYEDLLIKKSTFIEYTAKKGTYELRTLYKLPEDLAEKKNA